jgi:hypothetical protein
MIEKVVQGVVESARNELAGQIYSEEAWTGVNGLEARHRVWAPTTTMP